MNLVRKLLLLSFAFLVTTCTIHMAWAGEPPADLCSLLPSSDVSKIMGQAYDAPEKSVAPRPFANTNTGTDCHYHAKSGHVVWFRAYVDPSPAAATELFDKLSKWFGTKTPVNGLGDEAYFDQKHAIHVRKGKVRFYIDLSVDNFTPTIENQ